MGLEEERAFPYFYLQFLFVCLFQMLMDDQSLRICPAEEGS